MAGSSSILIDIALQAAAAGYRYDIYKLLRDCGVEYSLCEHPKYGEL
jgi:hypothetical protein